MKDRLLIYGSGGLGKEVLALARSLHRWKSVSFVDDNCKPGSVINDCPVIGDLHSVNALDTPTEMIIAIGDPRVKSTVVAAIKNVNVSFPTLIHPSVIVYDTARVAIGKGTVISAGTIITTNVSIGDHVLINLNCTIGHDAHIGNLCSIMPGVNIAGEIHLEERVFVGAGANLINRITVGKNSKIGMGAAVIRNVSSDVTVVGVPANEVR